MYLSMILTKFLFFFFFRITVLFFALSGLDVLNSVNYNKAEVDGMIDWIYALQILPKEGGTLFSK